MSTENSTEKSKEHTTTRILDEASALLDEVGIGGFRFRDLAERCDLSPGTLTYYFPSKEKLFESLVTRVVDASWKLWSELSRDLNEQALPTIATEFYRLCLQYRPGVRLIMHYSSRDGEVWSVPASAVLKPLFERVEKKIGKEHRLAAHATITQAITYAVYSEKQLRDIAGETVLPMDAVHRLVEEHLIRIAQSSLPAA